MNIIEHNGKTYHFDYWSWVSGPCTEERIEETTARYCGEDVPGLLVHITHNASNENHIVHHYIYKDEVRRKYGKGE